ncbi:hypothetical protein PsPhPollyC_gp06 [Pseudomonas phage PollyC]|uniref:Uncharacterized protein n=1 Tax=Pseudomonas phage PollyC TaxID=2079290 RepID=A0A2K9VHY1_9CAUD|nr:hypothetical protein FDJ29_gp44 [Pseudomonas phage PollyC]AUV61954.1 hypothetical protein PsPhPollyC_gp06 [Pseudomonas phage PollyC]
MRATTLLKPGKFSNSERLRRDVALAISNIEVAKAHGADGQGAELAAFLADSAQKTPGYTAPAMPPTQVVVSNGATVNVENSAGNLDSPGVATVAAGALSGVRLAATKTILTSGTKVNAVAVTGTGNFATPTIANGVLTGIVLSDS